MQVRFCEFPESFGKDILQREGVVVRGYVAAGGKTVGQCVRDQKVVARASGFPFVASN